MTPTRFRDFHSVNNPYLKLSMGGRMDPIVKIYLPTIGYRWVSWIKFVKYIGHLRAVSLDFLRY